MARGTIHHRTQRQRFDSSPLKTVYRHHPIPRSCHLHCRILNLSSIHQNPGISHMFIRRSAKQPIGQYYRTSIVSKASRTSTISAAPPSSQTTIRWASGVAPNKLDKFWGRVESMTCIVTLESNSPNQSEEGRSRREPMLSKMSVCNLMKPYLRTEYFAKEVSKLTS